MPSTCSPLRWWCGRQASRTGKVYNLGLPVQRTGVPVFDYRGAPQRLTLTSQTDEANFAAYGAPSGLGANEDTLVIPAHNGTHVDALAHVYSGDQFYNGYSKDTFTSQGGAGRGGIDKTGGYAARAVLADLAGQQGRRVPRAGLSHQRRRDRGMPCRAGCFGGARRCAAGPYRLARPLHAADGGGSPIPFAQPGLALSTVDFIRDNDLVAVGCDNAAIECIPFDDDRFLAFHIEVLVKLGVSLVEHLVLTPMALDKCYSAFFVVAPMRVTGGTGSPVNPIAIG